MSCLDLCGCSKRNMVGANNKLCEHKKVSDVINIGIQKSMRIGSWHREVAHNNGIIEEKSKMTKLKEPPQIPVTTVLALTNLKMEVTKNEVQSNGPTFIKISKRNSRALK